MKVAPPPNYLGPPYWEGLKTLLGPGYLNCGPGISTCERDHWPLRDTAVLGGDAQDARVRRLQPHKSSGRTGF